MITIDEAINELKQEENHLRRQAEQYGAHFDMFKRHYLKRAANMAQIAEWLTDYKRVRRTHGYSDNTENQKRQRKSAAV